MIIKKCEHLGCNKAGTCRCPKDRNLKDYWYFCQQHAAEYNKNWNYYAGMTPDEINKEWEKDLFGHGHGDAGLDSLGPEYQKIILDFANGKPMPSKKKTIPGNVITAFEDLGLSPGDDWEKVQKKYRLLAKQVHPDTSKSKDGGRFVKISISYQTLKKYFNK